MTVGARRNGPTLFVAIASVAMAIAAGPIGAQMPDTPMPGAQMPGMPGTPMTDPGMQQPAQQSTKGKFKQLFAGTLAAVLQTSGAGLATGLATVMTGAIQNWFNKPAQASAGMDASAAGMGGMQPAPGMPSMPMGGMQPSPGMPTSSGLPTSPDMSMGGMQPSPGMPMGGMHAASPDMGMMPMAPSASGAPPSLYAGLAYEVQAIRAGQTITVDPATHYFASGDRFVVMYRPSLPGQVAIYNVNPLGQEKKIDAVNVAAGELTRLGPYEFQGTTGSEVLRLILSPCRNDGLMAMTRDIVKVDETATVAATNPAAGGLGLPDCSVVAANTVRPQTRDIVKVDSEEGTMFALDPVSPQEMQAGNFIPRELTLTFNHR